MIYTDTNLTIINTLSINFNTDFIKNSRIKKLSTKLYKKYKKLCQMLLIDDRRKKCSKIAGSKKNINITFFSRIFNSSFLFWTQLWSLFCLSVLLILVIFLLYFYLTIQNILDNSNLF